MKLCILIQAHKDFDFLNRIINRLRHKDVDIWLNIDSKSDISTYNFKDVYMVKNRTDVKWGDISQVVATMNGLKEIIASNIDYDRIIYISGQDYPIKPIEEIINFFEKEENKDKEFITCTKIDSSRKNLTKRWEYYYYRLNILTNISKKIRKRKFIKDYVPYFGSTWFNITLDAAKYIVNQYEIDNFYNYFKHTTCIDEIIPQSIIMYKSSPFKDKVVYKYMRYIDWSDCDKGLNSGNPNILKIDDYDKIIKSDAFFARKFDINIDSEIINVLDKYLDSYYEKNINCN